MPRKPRVHYPGAIYHVICRGNNREKVFSQDDDKRDYLETNKRYKKRYDFKLFAYCVLDNHAHLLIAVGNTELAKIMQGIQQVYTQKINKKYDRIGHIFQQRYKAILCEDERYLLSLIKYIHNNPVTANLNGGINYKWSSHHKYLSNKRDDLLDITYPLSFFAKDIIKALKEYILFMNEQEPDLEISLGNEKENALDILHIEDNKYSEDTKKHLTLDEIVQKVLELGQCSLEDLVNSKRQKSADLKKAIVLLSKKKSKAKNKEIAQALCIGETRVSKILAGEYQETEYLKNILVNFK